MICYVCALLCMAKKSPNSWYLCVEHCSSELFVSVFAAIFYLKNKTYHQLGYNLKNLSPLAVKLPVRC